MVRVAQTPRIRRSPFYDATIAAGVTEFTVYNKMLLPLSYGDLAAEYRRLTEGVAMWDVAAQRQVQVKGPEAGQLAQYLTARDLTRLSVGQGKYVALCDYDGSILNDPIVLKLADDRYWFSTADGDIALWASAIGTERGFNAVVSEPDVSPLAIQGPKAEDLVADLFGDETRSLRYFWFTETELDGIPLVLSRSGWSKQGGFELFLRDGSRGADLWERVAEAGERYDIGPGAPNHVERVESGLLSFGGDNTPGSNPFELGMAPFVDVDTPVDYIGKTALQKVVAEGPARLLVGLYVDADMADDWPLPQRTPITRHDRVVGTMSAVVWSPRLERTIGLAQIEGATVEAGAPVEVTAAHRTHKATVTSLPFI
ncbi:MAG: glycine cleavage system protein T [Acidimicrobiia bacterium]|nr:glycine cleavage system protein T [Acidimicrobiia bacterium]